jgi:hypothetical protein
LPEQDDVPGQLVVELAKAQAPPPLPPFWLHCPVRPQAVPLAAHSLSGSLGVTAAQVPLATPVLLETQASQVPAQPLLQQTPSTQNPVEHWLVPVQVAPFDCLGAQVPLVVLQYEPLVQFASAVQAVGRQEVLFMHTTPPGQAAVMAVPSTQLPAPSQAPALVVSWLPVHEDVPGQLVVAATNAHAPPPFPPLWSQSPVRPQAVPLAAHSLSGSVLAATAAQVPLAPPVLLEMQASQVPAQPLLQQTPSTQNPLEHWLVAEQMTPFPCLGVQAPVVVLQYEPLVQLASAVQVVGRQALALMHTTPPGQAPVMAVPSTQFPVPSQAPALVVSCPPVQDDVPGQLVLVLANAHAPLPFPPLWSQRPVRPQAVVPAAHSLSGSVFAVTAAQLPSATPVLVITHASQVP